MVLLNTHPDYMYFEEKPARDEYPVSRYEELLSWAINYLTTGSTPYSGSPRWLNRDGILYKRAVGR